MLVNAPQHVSIYLQPFTSYSEILVGNCNFFLLSCIQRPRWECLHWNSGERFGPHKTRARQGRQFDDRLSRFDTILACDRHTDGRTDRRLAYSNNVRSMTDAR